MMEGANKRPIIGGNDRAVAFPGLGFEGLDSSKFSGLNKISNLFSKKFKIIASIL